MTSQVNGGVKASLACLSKRQQIMLMGAVSILPLLPVTFFLPILPDIADSFGVTLDEFQLALPLFILTQVLVMPVVALLSDAGYRLHCLYWSLLLFVFGTLFCLLSQQQWLFFFGRILHGIAAAGLMTVVPAMVNECYEDNEVAAVLSYITAIGFIIPMTGPELSSTLAERISWGSVFWLILLYASVVAMICVCQLGKPETVHPIDYKSYYKSSLKHWKMMITDRYTLAFLVCNSGVAIVCQIYVSNSDFLYLEYFKLEELSYSYLLSVLYLSRMLVSVFNGMLLKNSHYLRIIYCSVPVLIILTLLTVVLDFVFHNAEATNLILPVMLFALSGFVLTNTLAGVLQNNGNWAMQAIALMFILFSGMASVINIILMFCHDGTPKVLSLFSLLILVVTYLLFVAILPADKPIR